MAKILCFEADSWEQETLTQGLTGHDVTFITEPLSSETQLAPDQLQAEVICTFIYSQLTKEVIEKFPQLKLIVTRSTGFDHIDLKAAKEKGIVVSNVPKYGIHTVSEHTWALLLSMTRKIVPSVEHTKKGNFLLEGLAGVDLFGKTMGVVGTGNIGAVVAEYALAFGMKVVAYNRSPKEELVAKGVQFVSFEELLGQSDFITFHVPLTPETNHMLNMQNMHLVKKGAFIVNASRGSVIETEALVELLQQKIVRGAALDVLEGECEIHEERELLSEKFLADCDMKTQLLDHQLLLRDDVIVTPHNAFHSEESIKEIIKTSIEDITSFLSGTVVNQVVGED